MKISILKIMIIVITTLTINVVSAQNPEIYKAENGMYGLKDDQGKNLLDAIYKDISVFDLYQAGICDCGYLRDVFVLDNGTKKALFSTEQMKLTTDFVFDTIYLINVDDLGIAEQGDKIGLIRLYTGKLITPIEMDSLYYTPRHIDGWGWMRRYVIEDKFIHFTKNGENELYDVDGKFVMSEYDAEKVVIIEDGENIFPLKRSAVGVFENGKAKVNVNGEEYYIDEYHRRIK